jgi:hypothetical protein
VASTNETLRQATADVFDSWIEAAARRAVEVGIPEPRARELAIANLASLEGAFILCRATRSTEPLEIAGAQATAAMREAVEAVRRRKRAARPAAK